MAELTSIPTREIRSALAVVLPEAAIVRLGREPVSRTVERLRIRLADGNRMTLMAKFRGQADVERERLAYQYILRPEETGCPPFVGALPERGWLFLAEAEGHPLSPDDPGGVSFAYAHLAAMHRTQAGKVAQIMASPAAPALRTSPNTALSAELYERRIRVTTRSLAAAGIPISLPVQVGELPGLLAATGLTLLHGDFHAGNVIMGEGGLTLMDWELCGVGSPLLDLAYLEPEGQGWPGAPSGVLAWHALRLYHEEGPLASMEWDEFLRAQRGARLWARFGQVQTHVEQLLRAQQAGASGQVLEVIRGSLNQALARAAAVVKYLRWN